LFLVVFWLFFVLVFLNCFYASWDSESFLIVFCSGYFVRRVVWGRGMIGAPKCFLVITGCAQNGSWWSQVAPNVILSAPMLHQKWFLVIPGCTQNESWWSQVVPKWFLELPGCTQNDSRVLTCYNNIVP
jgi:hypothetical protein